MVVHTDEAVHEAKISKNNRSCQSFFIKPGVNQFFFSVIIQDQNDIVSVYEFVVFQQIDEQSSVILGYLYHLSREYNTIQSMLEMAKIHHGNQPGVHKPSLTIIYYPCRKYTTIQPMFEMAKVFITISFLNFRIKIQVDQKMSRSIGDCYVFELAHILISLSRAVWQNCNAVFIIHYSWDYYHYITMQLNIYSVKYSKKPSCLHTNYFLPVMNSSTFSP
jgi:hypothetical protein